MASNQAVSPWAHGIAVFAGVVMIIGGAFQALEGLAGIVRDQYLVVSPNYIYAIALLRGQTWARVAGMVVAVISAILNFAWLPISPWWAVTVIVIDILVIWALASYLRQPEPMPSQDRQAAVH